MSRKIDTITEKFKSEMAALSDERDRYQKYAESVDEIRRDFGKLISDISEKQSTYDRLISQAKEMKKIVFNASNKVKIPLFVRIRLFFIMHKK